MSEKCCVKVYPKERFGAFHGSLCTKPAKVERNGKWYCTIHDPVRVADNDAKRLAAWNAQWAREKAAREAPAKRIAELEKENAELRAAIVELKNEYNEMQTFLRSQP